MKEYEKFTKYIRLSGSKKDIEYADKILSKLPEEFWKNNEGNIRIKLQDLIQAYKIKATILFDGNYVWDKDKILKNIKLIVKSNDMDKMTDYTYNFLHLSCGSIAHFNKTGWISTYPTVEHLKEFFKENEYGKSPLEDQSCWGTDRIGIIKEIEKILFKSGMKSKPVSLNI